MQSVSAISAHAFTKRIMSRRNEAENKCRVFHWTPNTSTSIEKPTMSNILCNGKKNGRRDDDDCAYSTGTAGISSSSVVTVIEDCTSDSPMSQHRSGNKTKNTNKNKSKKNGVYRDHRHVRFAPGTAPELTTKRKIKKRNIKKRKPSEQSSSSSSSSSSGECECSPQGALEDSSTCNLVRWWSKQELKTIQESCAYAVKTRDFMSSLSLASQSTNVNANATANGAATAATQRAVYGESMLDRFSEPNRKRRRLVRWQMYETTKVVRQYESATDTKAPPELLSELLRNYSKPMEMDAIESALRMRQTNARFAGANGNMLY
jgi:hypothetical protein